MDSRKSFKIIKLLSLQLTKHEHFSLKNPFRLSSNKQNIHYQFITKFVKFLRSQSMDEWMKQQKSVVMLKLY